VLVVDDDAELRELVRDVLVEHGYDVDECADGDGALERIDARRPDLVVLDLGLPQMGGLDVLRSIRQSSNLPVIVLTGRGAEADRIVGLEMGADDYVVKPFSPRELAARVRTVLRRSNAAVSDRAQPVLRFERLEIDLECRDVLVDGDPVELTAREFDLLAFLASSPRQVFTRDQLLQQVWSSSSEWQDPRTIAEHVHRLRRKIEPDPSTPRWIQTLRGAGYRFTP
jgi:DNA-binding response OmpR family regulator